MENYDIDRAGYHDTHDTMANIDLDYGAAVCAITIEAVARAVNSKDSPLSQNDSPRAEGAFRKDFRLHREMIRANGRRS